jgi:hypothetical protein
MAANPNTVHASSSHCTSRFVPPVPTPATFPKLARSDLPRFAGGPDAGDTAVDPVHTVTAPRYGAIHRRDPADLAAHGRAVGPSSQDAAAGGYATVPQAGTSSALLTPVRFVTTCHQPQTWTPKSRRTTDKARSTHRRHTPPGRPPFSPAPAGHRTTPLWSDARRPVTFRAVRGLQPCQPPVGADRVALGPAPELVGGAVDADDDTDGGVEPGELEDGDGLTVDGLPDGVLVGG